MGIEVKVFINKKRSAPRVIEEPIAVNEVLDTAHIEETAPVEKQLTPAEVMLQRMPPQGGFFSSLYTKTKKLFSKVLSR